MDNPRGDSSCSLFRGQIGFWNVGFCGGGKPQDPEINLRSNDKNQQQSQPVCDDRHGNRTRNGGKRGPSPLRRKKKIRLNKPVMTNGVSCYSIF